MRTSRLLAIDCGAAHVSCGLFEVSAPSRVKLRWYHIKPLDRDDSKEPNWTEELTRVLAEMRSLGPRLPRQCIVGVPGHLLLTRFVTTPSVSPEQRDKIVRFEASQNIPYGLSEVSWGHTEVADNGVDLELMLAAARQGEIETLCAAMERAGLVPIGIEPSSVALARTCLWQGDPPPALYLDIGARSTHLVFAGKGTFFIRTLRYGGDDLTRLVAEALQLPFADAEATKLRRLSNPSGRGIKVTEGEAVDRACGDFVAHLQQEIRRSRLSYSRRVGAMTPETVWLMGAGSRIPELSGKLFAELRLPVHSMESLAQFGLSSPDTHDGAYGNAGHLAALTGLALSSTNSPPRRLELLPSARRIPMARRRVQVWWRIAVALMLAAMMPPMTFYWLRTAQLKQQLSLSDRQLMPLRQRSSQNEANLNRLRAAMDQVRELETAVKARTSWVAFMADLQERLRSVGDVWIDRLEILPVAVEERQSGTPPDRRLALAGRLLDVAHPLAKASSESYAQAKRLINSLGESPFVQSVTDERFDNSQPGILRFTVTLVLDPENPL